MKWADELLLHVPDADEGARSPAEIWADLPSPRPTICAVINRLRLMADENAIRREMREDRLLTTYRKIAPTYRATGRPSSVARAVGGDLHEAWYAVAIV